MKAETVCGGAAQGRYTHDVCAFILDHKLEVIVPAVLAGIEQWLDIAGLRIDSSLGSVFVAIARVACRGRSRGTTSAVQRTRLRRPATLQ